MTHEAYKVYFQVDWMITMSVLSAFIQLTFLLVSAFIHTGPYLLQHDNMCKNNTWKKNIHCQNSKMLIKCAWNLITRTIYLFIYLFTHIQSTTWNVVHSKATVDSGGRRRKKIYSYLHTQSHMYTHKLYIWARLQ